MRSAASIIILKLCGKCLFLSQKIHGYSLDLGQSLVSWEGQDIIFDKL